MITLRPSEPRRNPVWPSATRTVIVAHADGSETETVGTVVYEPGTAPPPPIVRYVCVRACSVCADAASETAGTAR